MSTEQKKPAPTVYPIRHDPWIWQYDDEVFVVYDPTTGGSQFAGVCHTLAEAQRLYRECVA